MHLQQQQHREKAQRYTGETMTTIIAMSLFRTAVAGSPKGYLRCAMDSMRRGSVACSWRREPRPASDRRLAMARVMLGSCLVCRLLVSHCLCRRHLSSRVALAVAASMPLCANSLHAGGHKQLTVMHSLADRALRIAKRQYALESHGSHLVMQATILAPTLMTWFHSTTTSSRYSLHTNILALPAGCVPHLRHLLLHAVVHSVRWLIAERVIHLQCLTSQSCRIPIQIGAL